MTIDSTAIPDRPATLCRASHELPCRVEALVVAAPRDDAAVHAVEAGAGRPGAALCLAAVRSRVAALDPTLALPATETWESADAGGGRGGEFACGAAAQVAARVGLGDALRLRFHLLAPVEGGACELLVQPDAARGLSVDEQTTLLRIAEEAVGQVMREGSREIRIGLRRSRLGPVELSICGGGGVTAESEVAASFRSLALIRRLAARIHGRLAVRRLVDGALFVRCGTRWMEGATGQWQRPK